MLNWLKCIKHIYLYVILYRYCLCNKIQYFQTIFYSRTNVKLIKVYKTYLLILNCIKYIYLYVSDRITGPSTVVCRFIDRPMIWYKFRTTFDLFKGRWHNFFSVVLQIWCYLIICIELKTQKHQMKSLKIPKE